MKPILFNTDMVKAILEGRKTVTRRLIRLKYDNTHHEMFTNKYGTRLIEIENDIEGVTFGKHEDGSTWRKLRGYIEPKSKFKAGEILYVRETWNGDWCDHVIYKADGGSAKAAGYGSEPKWHPSIHMPKEAARLFLKVTSVRAERLQNINPEQSIKEGLSICEDCFKHGGCSLPGVCAYMPNDMENLWNTTIKKADFENYGWEANPWVWVIEFERISKEKATQSTT